MVPSTFRFSVKVPKVVTHERCLIDCETDMARYFAESSGLGACLGVYLVQLPPSLAFDHKSCSAFFANTHSQSVATFVVEPRHATWFTDEADACLQDLDIGRVAADPAILPIAGETRGSQRVNYFRLHGSPRTYYSSYSDDDLRAWHAKMKASNPATAGVFSITRLPAQHFQMR